MAEGRGNPGGERLASAAKLKDVMGAHFAALGRAEKQRTAPVAWCTSVGPVELLRALGYEVFFPENHGAMLGASRMANEVMGRAHAIGYSPDICSYLTSDIGSYLARKTPLSKQGLDAAPKPDVLLYSTNQCRDVRDWFEFYGREWKVPVVGVSSFRNLGEIRDSHVDCVVDQMQALVPALEKAAGAKLAEGKLQDAVRLSRECSDLWRDCLRASVERPSPMTFFDATIQMGPAVVLRGTEAACDYYRVLRAELEQRAQEKKGAVADERFRLFWDGMPVWGKLKDLSNLFGSLRACIVASTYCNSWVFEALDPADPWRSMARASLELFIVRSEDVKLRELARLVQEFSVDGVIFHDARTCPNNSNSRYGMPGRLRELAGVPVLTIDGDLNDLRCFSEEQSRTNIEGFIEQLEDA